MPVSVCSAKIELPDNQAILHTRYRWLNVNAQDIIKKVDITTEAGIYAVLEQASVSDTLLYAVIKTLKLEVGSLKPVLDDALNSICYFYEDSADSRMATLAKRYIRKIEGQAFKGGLLKRDNGDLCGVQLANTSASQFAVFLPDASEPGRVRYSCFDKRGFFSHATYDTYQQALDGAWLAGFRIEVENRLQTLCMTEDWSEGSKITAAIQLVNAGKLTKAQFLSGIAA